MATQSCRTCKWAEWPLMKNGKPFTRKTGKCKYELPHTKLPVPSALSRAYFFRSYESVLENTHVTADSGTDCPCYEAKGKK